MGDFNYDALHAPQYVDFTSPDALKDYGEEYFDMDHEIEIDYHEDYYNHEEVVETITEIKDELIIDEIDAEFEKPKLRRSVSANEILVNIAKIEDVACNLGPAMEALSLSENKDNKLKSRIEVPKSNLGRSKSKSTSVHNLNRPLYQQRSRAVSRDAINKIGQPKGDQLKRKMSVENLQPSKYISLAEAVIKFQRGTPKRFHSQATKTQFNNHKNPALANTIPQSPMLSTKSRSRTTSCVSRNEQEQMEADEMKKNQIKAHAVNYKILRAPVLNAKVEKKPNTVPQPFRFTEVHFNKPTLPSKTEVYEFHARPAPKNTFVPLKPTSRRSVMPIVATTPTFMRKSKDTYLKLEQSSATKEEAYREVAMHEGVQKKVPIKMPKSGKTPVKTKIEPFSFEQRDKMMQKRKEEKIKKFLDEEKKAREFHARPIPTKIAGCSGQVESKIAKMLHGDFTSNSSLNSLKNDENAEPNQIFFKAKPATVIHKKPFIPKKEDRPLLEISEFQLNTIKRAKEREEFEKKMKEKEEEYEKMKLEQEERQKQLEVDEYNKLRKETIHKANPVKHYKTMEILPSTKKITSPVSPMITKKRMSRMDH